MTTAYIAKQNLLRALEPKLTASSRRYLLAEAATEISKYLYDEMVTEKVRHYEADEMLDSVSAAEAALRALEQDKPVDALRLLMLV